jgi:putative hemolysin
VESIWLEIVLIAVAIAANGFFAGSEIALVSSRPSRLAQLRDERIAGAAVALDLRQAPDRLLATIQIAITLVGTLASAVGGAAAVGALRPWLESLGLPGATQWAHPVALGLVILGITYASLVIGELVPKAIALRDPERIASRVAPVLRGIAAAAGPLVTLLTRSTNLVFRIVGLVGTPTPPPVSEEEVRYLVREGTARGVFEPVEQELVQNVFEFADTTVREIMVPRPEIQGLPVETPPGEILQRVAEIGHSRVPVYRGSIEHPVGVVIMKDLLRAAAAGGPRTVEEVLLPALFVPESARISALLREFERRRQNLAMVVDEYGGVVGLVTLEDVLEEIVGEIREEREAATPRFQRLPDGSVLVDGAAEVWELRDQLGLPIPESAGYQTVAGFVIHALQTIPTPGISLVADGHRWTVVEMAGPRVAKLRVQREP